jgi:Holliday junction resolvase RusA-like endonuclease
MLFELEGLPPSTNQSLTVANGRLIHSSTARSYRKNTELALQNQLDMQIKYNPLLCQEIRDMEGKPLFVVLKFYSDWSTKNAGTIRKVDVANREKLLLDSFVSVMNKNNYALDDSQIFCLVLQKVYGEEEKTVIEIEIIKNNK